MQLLYIEKIVFKINQNVYSPFCDDFTHFLNKLICIYLNVIYTYHCTCCILLTILARVRKTYAPYCRLLVQSECVLKCISYKSDSALGLDFMQLGAPVLEQALYAHKCISREPGYALIQTLCT